MRVGIVGAGPGGLAAGCLLQARGFAVEIFEALDKPGGRNGELEVDGFKFDIGPTFFLMPDILKGIFDSCGSNMESYVDLKEVDPFYVLKYEDGSELRPCFKAEETAKEISKFSRHDAIRFLNFKRAQKKKFQAIFPSLQKAFHGPADLLDREVFRALPFLNLGSVYDELAGSFEDERVRLAFTFQAKYLGMSPFECPSLFSILSHIEHDQGVWHPIGGCNKITLGLSRLFEDLGGTLHLSCPVKKVITDQRTVRGVETASGAECYFDEVIMNADFAYGMENLFSASSRKSYNDEKISKLRLSCSTFMLYLGLDKVLDWDHHSIFFAQNYRKNVRELSEGTLSTDFSFYVHNPSRMDPTRAPSGKSALYVLVPVPNLRGEIDWKREKEPFRKRIYAEIQKRTGCDLEKHILSEKIVSPLEWEKDFRVYKGAVFSLAHNLEQMLFMRPRNKFQDFNNLYLVGGGTHPGSGLPTILQSAIISADLLTKKYAVKAASPAKLNHKIYSAMKSFIGRGYDKTSSGQTYNEI